MGIRRPNHRAVKHSFGDAVRMRARVRELESALRPFARFSHESWDKRDSVHDVFVPTTGPVWLYVGLGNKSIPHLHTDAFETARRVLG